MSWTAFILAALKALPEIIALAARLKAAADARTNQGIGYDRATLESLQAANAELAKADAAVEAARNRQRDHAGDAGLDDGFARD